MLGLLRHRLSPNVRFFKKFSDTHIIDKVNLPKVNGYLEINDRDEACEKALQAVQGCNRALIGYVKKLETTTDVKIVPEHLANPWNYRALKKLCEILTTRADPGLAEELDIGWTYVWLFAVDGAENDLSVHRVKYSMPRVIRFMDIVEKELSIDRETAMYLKEHLFK